MSDGALLAETEQLLQKHSPATFDNPEDFGFGECIEHVRAVEDQQAWQAGLAGYPSLEAFYAAHEARHPDIRLYAKARSEIASADLLTSPGGLPSERLRRLRDSAAS